MPTANHYVFELPSLTWPPDLATKSPRFRLFVAANVTCVADQLMANFAAAALQRGMVYFCAWGPDCGRFHDLVDEVVVARELSARRPVNGQTKDDVIITTWHEDESLEEALEFFMNCAFPTEGLAEGSDCWVAISVGYSRWAATMRQELKRLQR